MKRVKLTLTILFIALLAGACNYDFTEDMDINPDLQVKTKVFKGGNVDCGQLSLVNSEFENLSETTGRNDFDQELNKFFYPWPTGLEVEVMPDGSISWALTAEFNLKGDGSCYKVGAVIVKAGTASNVYYYGPEGSTGDMGLVTPENASGGNAQLSNLTFCFIKCQVPALVVGFKSYMNTAFVTTGSYITSYPLVLGAQYKLYYGGTVSTLYEVGYLKITDSDNDKFWEVTVDNSLMKDKLFTYPYLYVGPAAGFNLNYANYPYPVTKGPITPADTWTYELDFMMP